VGALVPAALMTGGDAALIIAAALFRQWPGERLLRRRARDFGEVRHAGAETTARRGLLFANCHSIRSSTNPSQRCPVGCVSAVSADFGVLLGRSLGGGENVDALARGDAHHSTFGVLTLTQPGAGAADLAHAVERVHRRHCDVEDRLDGDLDLGDRKSTRLNSSHVSISYAVFCLKKKR